MLKEDAVYIPCKEEKSVFDELRGNLMNYMYSNDSAEDALILEEIFRIIRDLEKSFEWMTAIEERNKELEKRIEDSKADIW